MSEDDLHPLETILRLCAAAAPQPWYPRLYAKEEGIDRQALALYLEELSLSGLIERADGGPEKGPAIALTREGQRVLLDPEALQRLRAGQPVSTHDRAALARQALSGRVRPWITRLFAAINVVIFLAGYCAARQVGADAAFLRGSPLTAPAAAVLDHSGALIPSRLLDGQWWRLLTAGFVHVGLVHLLMNLVFLYLAGRFVEPMWGHVRYLLIYLAGVLGGSCLGLAHNIDNITSASEAVCGLIGAEAVWFLFNRRYLPRAVLRPMRTSLLVTLVLLVFISSFKNVGGWGVFGGAAAGAIAALLLQLHRFGPSGWRWLVFLGIAPLVWYGHFVFEQARATDPKWHAIEDQQFEDRFARSIEKVMKKARTVYAEEIKPVLEIHPTRRDPAKVQAVLPVVEEQKRELTSLAEGLARAGPYHSPEAEEAREVGRQYALAGVALFNLAEQILHKGEKRTDKDRQALREQEQQIEERRREWRELLQ